MERNVMYKTIKELNLGNAIFAKYGKHYTNVSNDCLMSVLQLVDDIVNWQKTKAENHIQGERENPYSEKLVRYALNDWQIIYPTLTSLVGINVNVETLALGYKNGMYYYNRLKELLNV